ncbi:NACHT domain-containing protein [Nodosilinea nodulosa]|uniref:NACHT domain-containing protein n=1 Tax=Nodosilinea nodulosa TaxID=416001 RepID=UPI0002D735C9|nr:NACHT domain-containing protein [Nodosilinea nodulosa]
MKDLSASLLKLSSYLTRKLYIAFFIISLLVTIGLSAPLAILAQTPAPTTRAEFIQVIEQQAAKDQKNGISRKDGTDTILSDAYTNNEFGVSSFEIRQVYDEAYSEAEEANKPGLLRRLLPKDGVVIGSLILVAGIIGAVLKDSVTQFIKGVYQKIDNWFYARYAGTPLFEAVALRRYRTKVFETNRELKIPFRVNYSALSMEEIFVPLKVAGEEEDSEVDAYQCLKDHKRIVVKGPPGSGKTMLLRNLALAYGTGRLHTLLADRPIPVLLELHRVNDPKLTAEQLIDELVDAFKRNDFPKARRFIEQSLESGKLMLLLDGLDEVSRDARSTVTRRINDLLNQHSDCRAIVTCRTQVYGGEFDATADQGLEVVEFSDQQIRRFLESWQQDMPPEKSINQLLQTLQDRPRIMALARNPLLLTIIAYLYTDTPFVLPHSRAEFYQKSTDILLDQWQKDFNQYRANDKRRILQHLALYNQDQGMQARQDRRSIDYETVLAELRSVLPDLNLSPDSAKLILDEIVERSGLFLKIDSGDKYQFAHLTVQEFFAAVALQNDVNGLIERFEQEPTAWREVVKLWCGLSGDSTRLIKAIYNADPLTGFECLADAQEVDPNLSTIIIAHFKQQLGQLSTYQDKEALYAAFGAVAADLRPRGREVFIFLANTLVSENSSSSLRFSTARALAMTNLPMAAEVLTNNYREETRSSLVKMGDIAVPALARIITDNDLKQAANILDDLFAIGTPEASRVLADALFRSEQSYIKTQAAWSLASLMQRPSIEEGLKFFVCPDDQKNNYKLSWVWKPFLSDHSSGFLTLTSVISTYLVDPSPVIFQDRNPHVETFDPRFVIALCGVSVREIWGDEVKATFDSWPPEADTLLAQETALLNPQQLQSLAKVDNTLMEKVQAPPQWFEMMLGVGTLNRLSLLKCFSSLPSVDQSHWDGLFNKIEFTLRASKRYNLGVLGISLILSGIAIFEMGWLIFHYYEFQAVGILGLCIWIVIVFWLSLLEDNKEPFESNMFWSLGISNLLMFRFSNGLKQLYQRKIVIPEVEILLGILIDNGVRSGHVPVPDYITGALAVFVTVVAVDILTGAVAITVAGALAVFVAFIVAGTVTGAVAGAGTVAGAVAGAVAVVLAVASAGAFVVTDANADAIAVANAGAVAGAVAGLGLGAWARIYGRPKNRWLYPLSILAFPWFCWAPLTLVFGTLGVHTLLGLFSPVQAYLWPQTFVLVGTLVLVASGLGWSGYRREKAARNPLQGGHLERTLRSLRR